MCVLEPPDHITHKLLPKAEAIIMFVKDPIAFTNMLETIGQYPWWNKRAKFLILCLDKRQDSTKVRFVEIQETYKINLTHAY